MKKMKKLLALLIATIMVLSMGTAAFAASNYTITIDNTSKTSVSISGKTYDAYKLFDVTYTGSNQDDPHAYTIDSDGDGAWAWSTLISGVTPTAGVYTNDTYGLTFTPTTTDPTVYVITNNMNAAKARKLADDLATVSKTGAVKKSATVATNAETVVIDVEQPGYWLVYGKAKPTDPTTAGTEEVVAACALTTTDPAETVIPKVTIPTIDKKVRQSQDPDYHVLDADGEAATALVGTTVPFEIDSTVPDLTGYSDYTFKITDTMTSGLSYTGTDTENKINGLVVTINGTALTQDNTDLTKTFTLVHAVDSKTFTLTIPFTTLKAFNKDDAIVVTYDALINDGALVTNYQKNTAKLEYSNSPYNNDTNETPEKETYVFSINVDVYKFTGEITEASYAAQSAYADAEAAVAAGYSQYTGDDASADKYWVKPASNGDPLSGAKFKLYKGDSVPADAAEAWYKYDTTNKKIIWVTKANADEFTSGTNGNLTSVIQGLTAANTADNGTAYGLVETAAPTGYNPLTDPIPFTLKADYDKQNKQATVTSSSGTVTNSPISLGQNPSANVATVTHDVLNLSGTELPSTGGIGTTMFYIIGAILVIGAAVVLISKRRMNR